MPDVETLKCKQKYRSILLLFNLINLTGLPAKGSSEAAVLPPLLVQRGCRMTGCVLFSMLTAAGISAVQKSMDVALDTAVYLYFSG